MSNRLVRSNILGRRFGRDEFGFVDLPTRYSNVRIARIFAERRGECGRCFPHGFETSNATIKKNFRSWKHHRRTQYRVKPLGQTLSAIQ